jgi:hypothetical protein
LLNRELELAPFLSGSLYDAIGNYESGFYFSGTMIFISGVMLFILPWVQRKQAAKNLVNLLFLNKETMEAWKILC